MATTQQDITVHPEYAENIDKWTQIRDGIEGPFRVKSKGKTYLKDPSHDARKLANRKRYENYLYRAVFVPFTQETLNHILGEVYAKPAELVLPTEIEQMRFNIDGAGNTFDQQSKRVVGDNVSIGRVGLFVDMPKPAESENEEGGDNLSIADTRDLIPTITQWSAEQIIDWSVNDDGNLDFVRLKQCKYERVENTKTGKKETCVVNYIMDLMLNGKVYSVKTWPEDDTEGEDNAVEMFPTKKDGTTFDYIPFYFIGSENNDPQVDNSPFEGISHIEFAYYRTSADYEENVFVTGQTTIVLAMGDAHYQFLKTNNIKNNTGTGQIIYADPEGEFGTLQMEASGALKESKDEKVTLVKMLGARITDEKEVETTATEANIENRSKSSKVISAVTNTNSAYTKAFLACVDFMTAGEPNEDAVKVHINTDYNFKSLSADEVRILHDMKVAESISEEEFRALLANGGWKIEENLEKFRDMIETQV